jgi:hypothetical protein
MVLQLRMQTSSSLLAILHCCAVGRPKPCRPSSLLLKLYDDHVYYPKLPSHDNTETNHQRKMTVVSVRTNTLFVEIELVIVSRALDLCGISILQVNLDDVISVLPHGSQAGLLHDRGNDGTAERIVSRD